MTNSNDYPSAEDQARVIDSTHGIEHILDGRGHNFYPWYWDTEKLRFFYYLSYDPQVDDYTRARYTSYGEAFNRIARERGLPEIPPLAWSRGIGKGQ